MNPSTKLVTQRAFGDFFLLCFPIWVPFIFIFSLEFSPKLLAPLALLFFFILREVHFGATWLFFFNKENRAWFFKRPWVAIGFPAIILLLLLTILLVWGYSLAFLLTNLASWYHVTRQSIGVNKIYSSANARATKAAFYYIFLFSTLFLIVGFLRFYSNIQFSPEDITLLTFFSIIACLLPVVFFMKWHVSRDLSPLFHLSAFTGALIFLPYCFAAKAEHALLIGVGMHWLQYIALILYIYHRRSEDKSVSGNQNGFWETILSSPSLIVSFLVIYPLIVALLNMAGQSNGGWVQTMCSFIVLGSYNLHFYYDAFMWRFSDPHIRKNIGSYLFHKPMAKI